MLEHNQKLGIYGHPSDTPLLFYIIIIAITNIDNNLSSRSSITTTVSVATSRFMRTNSNE